MKTHFLLKNSAFFFVLWFLAFSAKADNKPTGACSAGMAHASVMRSGIWSVFHNQAGLAGIEFITFASHFENAYQVKELSLKSLAVALPTGSGVFGLNYSHFGYSQYNESKAGLAFGKYLGKRIAVGIQLDYFHTHIAGEYGNTGALTAEIGLLAEPIDNFFVGAHVFNPHKAEFDTYDHEPLPTIFRAGAGYNFADKVFVSVEAEKDIDFKTVFKAGIEYEVVENIFLRAGISTEPTQNTFGAGWNFRAFKANIAFSRHQVLGYTTHASISYSLNGKKQTEKPTP